MYFLKVAMLIKGRFLELLKNRKMYRFCNITKYVLYFIFFFVLFWLIEDLLGYYIFGDTYKFILGTSPYGIFIKSLVAIILVLFNILLYLSEIKRNRMNKVLLENEIRYKKLSDATFDAILVSKKGICTNVNKLVYEMTGYENKDIVGQSVLKFVHKDYQKIVYDNIFSNIETIYDIFGVKKDGTTFPCKVKSKMINADTRITIIKDTSNKYENHKALEVSEEKFRLITENSTDLIWMVDLNLRFTYVSPAITNMLGYIPEECLGNRIDQYFTKESLAILIAIFDKDYVNSNGVIPKGSYELQCYKKDGSKIWINILTVPYENNGSLVGIQGTARDVTIVKRFRDTLAEREEKFRLITENSIDVIWTVDVNLETTYVSPSIFVVSGYTPQEYLMLPLEERFDAKMVKKIRKKLVEFNSWSIEEQKKAVINIEGYRINKDKSITGIRFVCKGIFKNNTFVGLQGTTIDISERLEAKKKLEASEEQYRQLIETTDTGFVIIDAKGIVIDANLNYLKLTGRKDINDIIGCCVLDWTHKDSLQINKNAFDLCIRNGFLRNYELDYVDVDGNIKSIDINASVSIRDGKFCILALCRDISERKKKDAELKVNERQYRTLADNSIDMIWIQNLNFITTYVSPSCLRLTGYTEQEHYAMTSLDEQYTEDSVRILKDVFFKEMDRPLEELKKRIVTMVVQYKHKTGFVFPVEIICKPIFEEDKIVGIQGVSRDITDRINNEALLKRSEKQYRTLVDSLPVAIYRTTPGRFGKYITVNKKFCDIFGYTKEEILEVMPCNLRVDPSSRQEWSDIILRDGKLENYKFELLKKDGSVVYGKASTQAIYDDIIYFDSVLEDITEIVKVEDRLKNSEEQYRNLIRSANEGVMISQNEKWVFVNEKTEELYGVPSKDLIGKSIWDFVAKEDLVMMRGYHDSRLRGEVAPQRYRYRRLVKPNNCSKWSRLSVSLITWNDKPAILFFINDIDENMRVQKKLAKSEERFKSIFDHTKSAVAVYKPIKTGNNLRFLFSDINSRCTEIENIKKENVIGKDLEEVYPSIEKMGLLSIMKQVYEDGLSRQLPISYYKDDRIEGWRENYVTKLPSGEILCVYEDRTEEKLADIEKKKLEKQLILADRLKSVGTLAAGIAHNYNNISATVLNNLNVMYHKDKCLKKNYEKQFANMFSALESTKGLTKDLLSASKVNSVIRKRIYDINELITDRCNLYAGVNKGVKVSIQTKGELFAEVDSDQFTAALMNILINAGHAMNDKGSINVMTKVKNSEIMISIEDKGCGISNDKIDKIFDPFFTTKGAEGSGIGLYTVYDTVRKHDGRIDVYSEVNEGTCFNIILPYDSSLKHQKIVSPPKLIKGNKELIMVVDDDDILREALTDLLDVMNYECVDFNDGGEAIEYYANHSRKIALSFLDLIMPGMGGYEVFKQLRSIDPDAKIIISSGFSVGEVFDKLKKAGCNEFVHKPYQAKTLSKIIDVIIRS